MKNNVIKRICCILIMVLILGCSLFTENPRVTAQNNIYEYIEENFKICYEIESQWENCYKANITVINTGEEKIENWALSFETRDSITQVWNAELNSKEKNVYTIKNAGWNQDITVGNEVSFGIIAEYENEICVPESYVLLGHEIMVNYNDYNVEVKIGDKWENGATVSLIITNTSNRNIEDWIFSFNGDFLVNSIWGARIVSNLNGKYVLKNEDYNSVILPQESIEVGFTVSTPNVNMTNFELSEITISNIETSTVKPVIKSVFVQKQTLLSGEKCKNRICVSIDDKDIKQNYFLSFYVYKNNQWEKIDELFDTGNLPLNGDEIKNDGTYSNIITFSEKSACELKCKVVVHTVDKLLDSQNINIQIINKLSNSELKDYYRINIMLKKYVDEKVEAVSSEINILDVIKELKELTENEPVKEIYSVDSWTIKVILDNGLITYVQITDESNMELMRRGSGEDDDEEIGNEFEFEEEEEILSENNDYVLANRVLLWAPYDSEWGNNDETEIVKENVNQSQYGLNLDIVSDSRANINSLQNLKDYGLIILATHGIEGKWIVTGETYQNSEKYATELQQSELSVIIRGEISNQNTEIKYMVNADWFANNVEEGLPNSIIINNSCSSLATEDFAQVFEELGALTYYGYSGAVTNDYVIVQTNDLLYNLISCIKTTGESYEYTYDSQYGGNYLGIRGAQNVLLPSGLMNGNFEKRLLGWNVDGDGRTITKLGSIEPTEGNYMGIISTGLGYTKELGELNQILYIPEDATKLNFDWNFLSEEFLEYIGSKYKDPFEIALYLTDEGNRKQILLKKDVNTIAKDFKATMYKSGKLISVSPEIVFDKGDVWMTDWQNESIDISKYAGQNVKLTFSVKDAVDTIYTTAILLDNITFDRGNIIPAKPVSVTETYSDETIRGLFSKTNRTGRSYVLYDNNAFSSQAKIARKRIKYMNNYEEKEQVIMKAINTEQQFKTIWSSMKGDSKTGKIDCVALVFHGTYYTINIDYKKGEYLVTNPYGVTVMGSNATDIRTLQKKKIGCIMMQTCDGGLLDAINFNKILSIDSENSALIKGNVAQAFLDSQNVDKIKAWDGSLSYALGYPRKSVNQGDFFVALSNLKLAGRAYAPKRGTYITYSDGSKKHIEKKEPKGEVTYHKKDDGTMYCQYSYYTKFEKKNGDGFRTKKTVKVKLINLE